MIHKRNGDFGVIMAEAGGPPHFSIDPVYAYETGTGTPSLVGGQFNLAGLTPPYIDMSPGFATGHDLGQPWNYYVEWNPFNAPITNWFKTTDTYTPTSTRRPAYMQPFAVVANYAGPPADSPECSMDFYLARADDSAVYDTSLHTIAALPDVTIGGTVYTPNQHIFGNELSSDTFWADLLGAHPLRFGIDAVGPGDSFWRLYAYGLQYPLLSGTRPPLRQVGRPDPTRQYPVAHVDGSRQVGQIP